MAGKRSPRKTQSTSAIPPQTTDPVEAYARAVIAGRTVAGPLVKQACERHLRDLEQGGKRGLAWRPARALRAIEFFSDVLRLVDIEENVVTGEKIAVLDDAPSFELAPWEAFIVGSLFGWYTEAGFRRFRVAYVEVGKGNGKSPLAAGVGLYMLVADGAKKPEVYAAAAVKDQARIQYRDAVNMVDASEDLSELLEKHGDKEVYNLVDRRPGGGFFKAISSEKRGLDGKRVQCALIDELHEHPNATVADKMRAGTKGRRNALIFEITNSGFDRTSVCYQHHDYSARILGGLAGDDSWFAYVCSLDADDDPLKDESCWVKANPNLGISIQPTYLREQVREARGMPSKASIVLRLNFCVWVDAENPWIDGALWRACEKEFEPEALAGRKCFGGLDLSGTRDLTALAFAFPAEDGSIDAFVEFWTPAETLRARSEADLVPYDSWVQSEDIVATPGRAVDYGFVCQRLVDHQQCFALEGVAFDPYRIKYFERELELAGAEVRLVPHGQGYFKASDALAKEIAKAAGREPAPDLWMPHSVELLESLVMTGKLRVRLNRCLQWNSASAVLESDAKNNRIFTKRRSKGRIDGLVALTMAVGLALNTPAAQAESKKFQLIIV